MEDDPEEEGRLRLDSAGNELWYDKNGRLHRINGPAVIYKSGGMYWLRHGKLHCDDGPAIIHSNGEEQWLKHHAHYEPTAHELIVWKMRKQQISNQTTQTHAI